MKAVEGFDYRENDKGIQALTRAEWRTRLKEAIKAGGQRVVDRAPGETWALDKKGRLLFEVYAVIPA